MDLRDFRRGGGGEVERCSEGARSSIWCGRGRVRCLKKTLTQGPQRLRSFWALGFNYKKKVDAAERASHTLHTSNVPQMCMKGKLLCLDAESARLLKHWYLPSMWYFHAGLE